MDQQSFDRLARLLGEATDRRAGLRAAFGALLGAGGMAAALGMDAGAKRKDGDGKGLGPDADRRKKRRKRCNPACGGGYECVKGQCSCPTSVTCGAACCRIGQVCDGGQCVADPAPGQCIAAGERCKNVGRQCCDGRVCASGQGGDGDVACYVPKTGACRTTADCVYGMGCVDGRCAPPSPAGLAQPCSASSQQLCTTSGAVCTAYDGAGAPGGSYCTLPLESACSGDKECTCYKCWYANPGTRAAARTGRILARYSCCGPAGYACRTDRNCCLGTSCVNGTCQGAVCAPEGGACETSADCCGTIACTDRVCSAAPACTISRSDFATDELAGAALKALVEATTGVETITIGPGVYKPAAGSGAAGLVVGRSMTLQACDPANKPILDGGAVVTQTSGGGAPTATDYARDLTWTGGGRIMDVPTGKVVVVDGVHFRNANAASGNGGAISSAGTLTLRNLDISWCRAANGRGGGAAAANAPGLTLTDVDITHCSAVYGGAIRALGTPLSFTGSAGTRSAIEYNTSGISYSSSMTGTPRTTLTLQHLNIRHNKTVFGYDTPGIAAYDSVGVASAEISDVDVTDNEAQEDAAGGAEIQIGNNTAAAKATLTNVKIQNNVAAPTSGSVGSPGGLRNMGKMHLGADVVISGNKGNYGSGVMNQAPTANVTCGGSSPLVSSNTSLTGTAAANDQTYADCFGALETDTLVPRMTSAMPAGCCATVSCTTVVCSNVCCASGSVCNGLSCP